MVAPHRNLHQCAANLKVEVHSVTIYSQNYILALGKLGLFFFFAIRIYMYKVLLC